MLLAVNVTTVMTAITMTMATTAPPLLLMLALTLAMMTATTMMTWAIVSQRPRQ